MQDNPSAVKKIKVRIKIGTVPYLGFVEVPPPIERVSDILNSNDLYLPLREVSSLESIGPGSLLLINKKEISYIQSLENTGQPRKKANINVSAIGCFTAVKIVLKDINTRVSGQMFIPFKDGDIVRTTNKVSYFLNLKDVKIEGTIESYSYLAISKSFIRTIESDGKKMSEMQHPKE